MLPSARRVNSRGAGQRGMEGPAGGRASKRLSSPEGRAEGGWRVAGGRQGWGLPWAPSHAPRHARPTLAVCVSCSPACLPAGRVRQAGELLDQLHAGGMVGTHQLYHGLLTSCQAAGEGELALEVFLGMQVGTEGPQRCRMNE